MIKDEVTKIEEELYHETDKINLQNRSLKPRIESQKNTDFFSNSFAKSGGSFHKNFEQKTFEKAKTISFVRGKGNLNHNNRVFAAKNVDTERTNNNVIFKKEKLADAYKKLFGDAIKEYNATQKRKCRKKTVKSYMEEIAKNEKNYQRTKLFYEQVIQFGTMNDTGNLTNPEEAEKAKQALIEYVEEFQERNKNLYVFNAVLHLDETTPHVHLDYIPVAREGAKRGLKTRNAFTQALKEQGIVPDKDSGENEFTAWRKREVEELKKIAEKHNIKIFEKHTEKRKNLNIDEYRELGRQATAQAVKEVQAEITNLEQKIVGQELKLAELQKANEILQKKLQQQQSTVAHQNEDTTAKTIETEKVQPHPATVPEEKMTVAHEQQQSITVPEEKQQPELSQPYKPYVSKLRPNEWKLREIEDTIRDKTQLLQRKEKQLEKLEKDAIAAAKSSWNVFKSLKELKQDYLKKHKAPLLLKEINKLKAEIEIQQELLKRVQQPPEQKITVAHEQQPEKKVKNKLVVKHREKDNARTRGGLSR